MEPSVGFIQNRVEYSSHFPVLDQEKSLLIYDKKLEQNINLKMWISRWTYRMSVRSGESLKSLSSFEKLLWKVHKENQWGRELKICVLGGGTLSDALGFLSSVYLRGVRWNLIPTTWLSAVDASHGGKTALNFRGAKNQLGSFSLPDKIYLSSDILNKAPLTGVSEFLKMAFLEGGEVYHSLFDLPRLQAAELWSLLPQAINFKCTICEQDFKEELGLRQMLNLGHTWGHVVESIFQIPHAEAVELGLRFALCWSHERGYLSDRDWEHLEFLLDLWGSCNKKIFSIIFKKPMSRKQVQSFLVKDKKVTSEKGINFVFLKEPGRCLIEPVSVLEIVNQAKRQEWIL